jgi:hypothetical protein
MERRSGDIFPDSKSRIQPHGAVSSSRVRVCRFFRRNSRHIQHSFISAQWFRHERRISTNIGRLVGPHQGVLLFLPWLLFIGRTFK